MKTILLTLFIVVVATMHGAASPIWADVREVANNSTKGNAYETTWGSYHYLYSGFKAIEVKLRNSMAVPATIGVQAIFFGRGVTGGIFPVSNQERVIDIGRTEVVAKFRAEYKGEDLNLALANYRDFKGARPHGWVVQVWQNGRVIERKASLHELGTWVEKNPVPPRPQQNK